MQSHSGEAPRLIMRQREKVELWTHAAIVVSKGEAEELSLGLAGLNNFQGLWT